MKRSGTTIIPIVCLAGLLVLLGGLQYRWQTQIAETESEKAHKRVQEEADLFAADFNREIQNAYFNFQTDSEAWRNKNWGPFNERYDYWREKTHYPALIHDFYFFEANGNASPLHYDREKQAFVPVEQTTELADLRSRFASDKDFKPVYDDIYTLVLPIHEAGHKVEKLIAEANFAAVTRDIDPSSEPQSETLVAKHEKYGYLAIRLDPETIKDKIIPDLASKYFGDGKFRVGVNGHDGQPIVASVKGESADAGAKLFDLSPDNYIFYTNKDLMRSINPRHEGAVVLNSRVESHTFRRVETDEDKAKTVKIEVQNGVKPRTQIFRSTLDGSSDSPWTLAVQHVSGSLDGFVAATLRRNLAIGFGLLFLLAAAVLAIIISAQRAKKAAQRQIDFVSSVSHEFRTPLAVIYSAGENLADGVTKENAQVSRYGVLIKGEGRKLSGMVEQILDFAGANSGRKKYSFAETSVSSVVEKALTECRSLIDDKKISVETKIAESLPPINADINALSQAVQNLIANSVKYSNGKAWLCLTAENGDGSVKISVEDRGIGISKSDLRQIFEPFFRSKTVVDAQIHGNGLGLSLVKQIVDAHGGRVIAESELGKGSRFVIEIPQK